jgi:hypothetical protein
MTKFRSRKNGSHYPLKGGKASYPKQSGKFYGEWDFKVTNDQRKIHDPRIAYHIVSRDGQIDANVFVIPGKPIEIRGLVGDNETLHIIYPLTDSHGKTPSSDVFLHSISRRLKEMNFRKVPQPSKSELNSIIKEEKETAKKYDSYGFTEPANDEKDHVKFFEEKKKELQ